ncbi:MAG: hypothetical protein D6679_08395 [Candidatus Hydrogenedentota bacterium]|nr:MAG: hypothetical protein D6679_08395 [Candidatus Hydrogenedentota bacterium]
MVPLLRYIFPLATELRDTENFLMTVLTVEPPALLLADVHLGSDPAVSKRFCSLLERIPPTTTVISLGDLLDVWAEGSRYDFGSDYPEIERLRTFPTYYLRGNRDFLLGPRWEHLTKGNVLGDETEMRFGNRTFRLLHGDTLVERDRRYKIWRRIARSLPFRLLASSLGESAARSLAGGLRNAGRIEVEHKKEDTMTIAAETAKDSLGSADVLVCGHTHKPGLVEFPDGKKWFTLGSWDCGGEVLCLGSEETAVLVTPEEAPERLR